MKPLILGAGHLWVQTVPMMNESNPVEVLNSSGFFREGRGGGGVGVISLFLGYLKLTPMSFVAATRVQFLCACVIASRTVRLANLVPYVLVPSKHARRNRTQL